MSSTNVRTVGGSKMRALILAMMLVAGSAGAAETVDLDTPPDWIKKPSYEDLNAVWPAKAMRNGISGKATILCQITLQGLLEACAVDSETPAGEGFGAAALLLAPSFVLKPGTKDGKPVSTKVGIPIAFISQGAVTSTVRTPMISEPVWDNAPSFKDMAAAWPAKAKAATEFGHVSMRCGFTEEGLLHRCNVLTETPGGQGFGEAARKVVAPKFRLRVAPDATKVITKAFVNLPIRFTNPQTPGPRTIVEPKWITQVDPKKVVSIYPPAAVEAGVKKGRGIADCMVAPDGKLVDCKPASANPAGLGFAEAAVQVASIMIMNPWSDGGGPVDGVRLKLPVTFNLAPEEAPNP
jgi:TonB family protein